MNDDRSYCIFVGDKCLGVGYDISTLYSKYIHISYLANYCTTIKIFCLLTFKMNGSRKNQQITLVIEFTLTDFLNISRSSLRGREG